MWIPTNIFPPIFEQLSCLKNHLQSIPLNKYADPGEFFLFTFLPTQSDFGSDHKINKKKRARVILKHLLFGYKINQSNEKFKRISWTMLKMPRALYRPI